jgi:hypothetical protein
LFPALYLYYHIPLSIEMRNCLTFLWVHDIIFLDFSRGGGIGRRSRLKICRC